MLPPEYLKPILSVLKGLVEHFKVTVVLCTATQPAFEGNIGSQGTRFQGIGNITPIIDKPKEFTGPFKRINISSPADLNNTVTWPEIAEELNKYGQVLCIVNRRNDCRELHSLMPKGTIHLSGLMCGDERSNIISAIKNKLKDNKPIRVISTQLVEAGVDIDFPVVYRAIAGMDSIAQAAGRCNREGKLNAKGRLGNVIIFNPPKSSPSGLLRKGEDVSKEILRMYNKIELSPDLFIEYFVKFYASVNDFDKAKFKARLLDEANEFKFQFRTFSADFKLIDDKAQAGIIVWYKGEKYDSHDLIDELIKDGPSPKLLRKLQRFTVNIPVYEFYKLEEKGVITCDETHGYYVQAIDDLYIPGFGLMYEADWKSSSFVQ